MPPPSVVLLPKLFPSDAVSLGQLLRSPLVPHANSKTSGSQQLSADEIVVADPEEPYRAIVSTDVRGRFEAALTKYLGAKINSRSANLLSIEADKLEYSSLKDASAAFKKICEDEDVKKWIGEMALHKAPCFFVIGKQTLHNAQFKRAILKEGGVGGYMTVPLEATSQVPLHIKGEISANRFGSSTAKVTGVFGVEVQRLRSKIQATGEPSLDYDVSWHWSYQRVKGSQPEDTKQLCAKLESLDDDELLKLFEALSDSDNDDDEDSDET